MPYYLTIEVTLSSLDPTEALVEAGEIAKLLDDETVSNVSVDFYEDPKTKWVTDN